jgi:Mycothiol maleylpyruvate isomerase N-terminal domain
MSHAGIIGMRSAGEDLVTVSSGLTEHEWQAPSAAAGWTVHDVVIHVGALLELLQAAVGGEAAPDLGTYPLHAIADMFTFDMTTHPSLRHRRAPGAYYPRTATARRRAVNPLRVVATGRDPEGAAHACRQPNRTAGIAPHWPGRPRGAHQP